MCIIDWKDGARYEYEIAGKRNVYEVGTYTAQVFQNWNLNPAAVDIVGHSFGAQIAGQAGMLLNGKLRSIFGLDPAGPLFCHPVPVSTSMRLDATDAQYVQVIYSNAGVIGCALRCGSQNFYPNLGISPQPDCSLIDLGPDNVVVCSHYAATDYFRKSLNPITRYYARRCSSKNLFILGFCSWNAKDLMGWYSSRLSGDFYLCT